MISYWMCLQYVSPHTCINHQSYYPVNTSILSSAVLYNDDMPIYYPASSSAISSKHHGVYPQHSTHTITVWNLKMIFMSCMIFYICTISAQTTPGCMTDSTINGLTSTFTDFDNGIGCQFMQQIDESAYAVCQNGVFRVKWNIWTHSTIS